MTQDYYMRFFWSRRHEGVEQAAQRLMEVMTRLKKLSPAFDSWQVFTVAGEREDIPLASPDAFQKALLDGRARRDSDGGVMEDAGFMVHFINHRDFTEAIRMDSIIGCSSPWVPNSLLLGPLNSDTYPELANLESMIKVAIAIIVSVEPEFGFVTSLEYESMINERDFADPHYKMNPKEPGVGWISYLSDGYWPIPDGIPCADRRRLDKLGEFLITTKEPFDTSNSEHVERAGRITQALIP